MAGSALAAFPGANGKIAFWHDPDINSGVFTYIFTLDPTGQNRTALTSGPNYDVAPPTRPTARRSSSHALSRGWRAPGSG
jgi:hypothetical protein